MKQHFVHVFHVVRSKFRVDAESDAEAIEKATALLDKQTPFDSTFMWGMETPQMTVEQTRELPQGFCYSEGANEVTGFLIDDLDDEDYDNSRFLDAEGNPQPPDCSLFKQITPRERDTILAALRFWKREGHDADFEEWILSKGGKEDGEPMTSAEIDQLIERIKA